MIMILSFAQTALILLIFLIPSQALSQLEVEIGPTIEVELDAPLETIEEKIFSLSDATEDRWQGVTPLKRGTLGKIWSQIRQNLRHPAQLGVDHGSMLLTTEVLEWGIAVGLFEFGKIAGTIGAVMSFTEYLCITGQYLLIVSPRFKNGWRRLRITVLRPIEPIIRWITQTQFFQTWRMEKPAHTDLLEAIESGKEVFRFKSPPPSDLERPFQTTLKNQGKVALSVLLRPGAPPSASYQSGELDIQELRIYRNALEGLSPEAISVFFSSFGKDASRVMNPFVTAIQSGEGLNKLADLFFLVGVFAKGEEVRVIFKENTVSLRPARRFRSARERVRYRAQKAYRASLSCKNLLLAN